jgi:hypothetical protein
MPALLIGDGGLANFLLGLASNLHLSGMERAAFPTPGLPGQAFAVAKANLHRTCGQELDTSLGRREKEYIPSPIRVEW